MLVAAAGRREQFRFHHAGLIGQRQEPHRLARDLMMLALFDDEAADDDLLTGQWVSDAML
jgi:hypothetical protein